jgi:hypothetical protein
VTPQEAEGLLVVRFNRRRHPLEIVEDLRPGSEIAASDLADHEGMHQDTPILNCLAELRIAITEMIHPDGCIGQYH